MKCSIILAMIASLAIASPFTVNVEVNDDSLDAQSRDRHHNSRHGCRNNHCGRGRQMQMEMDHGNMQCQAPARTPIEEHEIMNQCCRDGRIRRGRRDLECDGMDPRSAMDFEHCARMMGGRPRCMHMDEGHDDRDD